ncbi:MAG: hypothetical protein WCR67_07505, partial [Bacilli bacterium]
TKLANDTTDGGLVMTYGSEKVTPTQVAKRVSVVFDQESNNGNGIKFVDEIFSTDDELVFAGDLDVEYVSNEEASNVSYAAYFTLDEEVSSYVSVKSYGETVTAESDKADFEKGFDIDATNTSVYQLQVCPVTLADGTVKFTTINNSTLSLSYADGMEPSNMSEYNTMKAAIEGKKAGFFFAAF